MVEPRQAADVDIQFMDNLASRYDALVTKDFEVYHRRRLHPFLDRLAKEMPGGSLLDVGCGTAAVGLAAAQRGFRVVGIDHTPAMIEVAQQKARSSGLDERISFVAGDVESMPFTDGQFDAVACQQMLHHLPDIRPCIAEIARVLRPNGRYYIADVCRDRTPLKALIVGAKGSLVRIDNVKRLNGAAAADVGLTADLNSDDEYPISRDELLRTLDQFGLERDSLSFMTHLGVRSYLKPVVREGLIRALSFPWRHSRGDLLFTTGTRQAPPGSD